MLRIAIVALTCTCYGQILQTASDRSSHFVRSDGSTAAPDLLFNLYAFAKTRKTKHTVNALTPLLLAFTAVTPRVNPSMRIGPRANPLHRPSRSPVFSSFLASDASTADVSRIGSLQNYASDRVQSVKTQLRKKEIRHVLASSQFALQLAVQGNSTNIDFPTLSNRINRSIDILEKEITDEGDLLRRLKQTRELVQANMEHISNHSQNLGDGYTSSSISTPTSIANGTSAITTVPSLKLVREDGSVDWDTFVESSREVRHFSAEVWERLNGKDKEDGSHSISGLFQQAHVKNELVNAEVQRLRDIVNRTKLALDSLLQQESQFKTQLLADKAIGHIPSNKDLDRLKQMDERVTHLRKLITLSVLNLDVERICLYLQHEIEDSDSEISANLKILVAELNLIEREFMSVSQKLSTEDLEEALEDKGPSLLSLVDDEELELSRSRVIYLKSRLGIEGSIPPVIDWGSIGEVLRNIGIKIKEGLTMYKDGTQMLASDISYCWYLFTKASRGYTLKPREVNTFRRTIKDLLTLIPFYIIMIVPLTPVGHVLVFSFIQRYFPGFFPSCYSEKRLNLRRLYTGVLSKSLEDTLGQRPIYQPTQKRRPIRRVRNLFKSAKDRLRLVGKRRNHTQAPDGRENSTVNLLGRFSSESPQLQVE